MSKISLAIPAAIPVALAAVLASGCALTGAQIDYTDYNPSYDHLNFTSYHKDRDTRVVIVGDSLGRAPDAFARMVTDAMQGHNTGGKTNFTVTPGPSAEDNFRVVMAFDVVGYYGDRLCESGNFRPSRAAGVTTLQAAWCWGKTAQSYVAARASTTDSNDPRLRAVIGDVTRALFPQFMDPKLREDKGGGPSNPS